MRPHSRTIVAVALFALAGLTVAGCSSGKRRSVTNVSATASGTTGGTTSGTTGNTNTQTTPPPPPAPPPLANTGGGGNTSSGSATTGATAGGFGAGTGVFVDASGNLPVTTGNDWGAESGDFDGDGDVDVVIAVNGAPSRLLLNDGQANFVAGAFPATVMNATDVRSIDVENDGDFDLLFSSNFEPIRLFTNNGAGVFTLAAEIDPTNDAFTYKLAIGDANGDGFNDVFMARAGQNTPSRGQNRLFLNDQAGGFVAAPAGSIPVKFDDSLDATFLDVNGDGALDIFVANFGTPPSLLVNQGGGVYVNQSDVYIDPTISVASTGIAQGDMDRDGDIDLLIANEGMAMNGNPPAGEVNTLLYNQGLNTRFADASALAPQQAEATWSLRLVDVNGDGWLDVVAAQLRAVQRLYINQNGTLIDGTTFLPMVNQTPGDSFGVTVGDFNGDRAPDLLFVRRNATPFLFLNTP
jgi:FG-GAP-like repeat